MGAGLGVHAEHIGPGIGEGNAAAKACEAVGRQPECKGEVTGTLILGADETAEWGFPTFDGWVVDREFGQANKDKIVAFLKAIDQANASYLKDPAAWTVESAEVQTLATATGADPAQVSGILEGFTFLPLATQVGDTWLGGAGATIKGTADFLKSAGRIDAVVDDYTGFVNAEYAEAAK